MKNSFKKLRLGIILTLFIVILTIPNISSLIKNTGHENNADSGLKSFQKEDLDENIIKVSISISNLEIENIELVEGEIYQKITINGGGTLREVGKPRVPFKTVKILLPSGKTMEDIEVIANDKKELTGQYKIQPAQESVMIGSDEIPNFAFNEELYSSSSVFPDKLYSVVGIHTFRGYHILIVNIFPVQYQPDISKISYFEDLTIKVSLTEISSTGSFLRGLKKDQERILEIIINPEVLESYDSNPQGANSLQSASLNPDEYDYVIITNEALKNSNGEYTFQDLVSAREMDGIKATIVTVEEIYGEYEGQDNQEKIRNFIIDAYQTWGIEYVLLGGDADGGEDPEGEREDPIIPVRGFSVLDDDNIPSDLYYAGLDGNWDYDGDGIWGEEEDSTDPVNHPEEADLTAEVYVGRAPVDSAEEVSNFVRKTLLHESESSNYFNQALMIGEDLDWIKWGGDFKDEIKEGSSENGYTTVGFSEEFEVSTLYDRVYDSDRWGKEDLIPLLEDDLHIINHLGHSNVGNNMKMDNDDVDSLTNDKYFFIYSQGCYSGSFDNRNPSFYEDYDSIGEHFVTSAHGAFAYIGNSRYGWGDYYTTDSPSQRYDREFFDAIFGEEIKEIGRANQDSKEDCVGSIDDSLMRWCYYEINLLGDPMASISKFPHELTVDVELPIKPNITNSYEVNATVFNYGSNDESDINYDLYLNGTNIRSGTITTLPNGENAMITYIWTPEDYGTYNFTFCVSTVPDEMIKWNNRATKILTLVAHDLAVALDESDIFYINELGGFKSYITNTGLNRETNINFYLYLDGALVYSTSIPELISGESVIVEYDWTPPDYGPFNFTAYIEPVPEENILDNNNATYFVFAYDTPISIDDTGVTLGSLTWEEAEEEEEWCSLIDGTYIIEDLVIAGSDSVHGISIENSNASFIIRNCTIKYAAGNSKYGIYLDNVQNGTIFNNTCLKNYAGIGLSSSHYNNITGNEISNNQKGVSLSSSHDNNITGNEISNNEKGVSLSSSHDNNITGNEIFSNIVGIGLSMCQNNTILSNDLYNNGEGISLFNSHYNNITGNEFSNCIVGIALVFGCAANNIIRNEFYNNKDGITLNFLCGCTNISGNKFSYNIYGITSSFCLVNYISGNEISNNKYGITFYLSQLNNITDNDIFDNYFYGLFMSSSDFNIISGNNVSGNGDGIYIISCENSTLLENEIYSNINGIYIYYCFNTTFSENEVYFNKYGIFMDFSYTSFILGNNISGNDDGIYMDFCYRNFISKNNISNNLRGISLEMGASNNITKNTIQYNDEIGLQLDSYASDCVIYNNNFTGNGINAMDNSTQNDWDNGTIGNYWGDYDGFDIDDDGIGDSPYRIPGSGNKQDDFPIWDDGENADDWYEQNDNYLDAYNLTSYKGVWLGSIEGLGLQCDEDWYEFSLTEGNMLLYVDLLFLHEEGNLNLGLYDSNGEVLIHEDTNNDNEYIEFILPSYGRYYLLIDGNDAKTLYNLRCGRNDDNYEPNNNGFSAYDLTPHQNKLLSLIEGYGIQTDDDWYKFNAIEGQTVYIECLFTHENYEDDISLILYNLTIDNNGYPYYEYVDYSFSNTDNEYIEYEVPSTDNYYLLVYGQDGGNTYDLRWYTDEVLKPEPPVNGDDDDGNDDKESDNEQIPLEYLLILIGTTIGILALIYVLFKRKRI